MHTPMPDTVPEIQLEPSWKKALSQEFNKKYFLELRSFIRAEYTHTQKEIYPHPRDIFKAFLLCPIGSTKVVILGQDPYHGKGQATGLSFSVPDTMRIPPSLKNIFKEIEDDTGVTPLPNGNLERWAKQGVLLLNTTLTVEAGKPGSHQEKGWEQFTDSVIKTISDSCSHVVFILWGNYARKKASLIDSSRHLILESAHPSPFSAHSGFFGCMHFSKANSYLIAHNKKAIDWK